MEDPQDVPTGATLNPDAKPDPEATRRFSERFVEQARDHIDRDRADDHDEED